MALDVSVVGVVLLTCVIGYWLVRKLFLDSKIGQGYDKDFHIAIIGGGFGGIGTAVQLKKQGFNNFTIYEKASSVGGTWYHNSYPGCACDIASVFYCYSFDADYPWSRTFPPQTEILGYIKYIVDKYDIGKHIELNHNVKQAKFNKISQKWELEIEKIEKFGKIGKNNQVLIKTEANAVVLGLGQLNVPKIPNFEGLNQFGKNDNNKMMCHSSEWNDKFDYNNKRIGMIGVGPSGVQIGPELAKVAKKLYIFQRSISHAWPKGDAEVTKWYKFLTETKYIKNVFFVLNRYYRYYGFLWMDFVLQPVLYCKQNDYWHKHLLKQFSENLDKYFPQTLKNEKFIKLRNLLIPPFPILTKRVLFSDDWFAMLKESNVQVVTSKVKKMTENGIVVLKENENGGKNEEEIELDAIVLATGFDTQNFVSTINIINGDNETLLQCWKNNDKIEAYYGILVNKFPNLFLLYGPNTNLGAGSIIFMLECQINYITKCIKYLLKMKYKSLQVKEKVQANFNKKIQKDLIRSNWATDGVTNWYKNKFGKVVNNWPYKCSTYWLYTRNPNFNDDFDYA